MSNEDKYGPLVCQLFIRKNKDGNVELEITNIGRFTLPELRALFIADEILRVTGTTYPGGYLHTLLKKLGPKDA